MIVWPHVANVYFAADILKSGNDWLVIHIWAMAWLPLTQYRQTTWALARSNGSRGISIY